MTKNDIDEMYSYFGRSSNHQINRQNIAIKVTTFSYGMGSKNPLENVRVFNKNADDHAFKIEKDQISQMLTNVFEEQVLRVYCREADQNLIEKVYSLFHSWSILKGLPKPVYGVSGN